MFRQCERGKYISAINTSIYPFFNVMAHFTHKFLLIVKIKLTENAQNSKPFTLSRKNKYISTT